MCGPSGNDRATQEAQQAEDARKRQVASATSAIDSAFGKRGSQLGDFAQALRGEFNTEALKQKAVADRQLKFALARGGLTKGSADVDANALLGEEFQKGLASGERGVQQALSDLAGADEASRQNLISLAQGGASVSSSAAAAANALRSNIQGARSSSVAEGLGDIFANTRNLYVKQQESAARRRGLEESEVFADPFSR